MTRQEQENSRKHRKDKKTGLPVLEKVSAVDGGHLKVLSLDGTVKDGRHATRLIMGEENPNFHPVRLGSREDEKSQIEYRVRARDMMVVSQLIDVSGEFLGLESEFLQAVADLGVEYVIKVGRVSGYQHYIEAGPMTKEANFGVDDEPRKRPSMWIRDSN